MSVPDWYPLLLLSGAVFRMWRLLAVDTILERQRAWAIDRYGDLFEEWLLCPWCCGAWVGALWFGAWQLWPHATLVPASFATVLAVVGLVAKLDK